MKIHLNAKKSSSSQIHFFFKKRKKGKSFDFCSPPPARIRRAFSLIFKTESSNMGFGQSFFFRDQGGKSHHLGINLGKEEQFNEEKIRELFGLIVRKLRSENVFDFSFDLDSLPCTDKKSALKAVVESLIMSDYHFDHFKSNKNKKDFNVFIRIKGDSAGYKKQLNESRMIAEGVNFARYLGDCPGNFMTPKQLGEEAKKSAKGTKMKVSLWDKARIKKEKMDSLIGVSNGSDEEPCFIIMEYKGAAPSRKPLCFVGKGLTFDSGGISIKPSAKMEEMKFDMCGGAAVIAAVACIARLNLKVNVLGLVPASENMPGPSANKPGDIRRARNGKSIEINNTDAEGRLILADALSYASEKKPAWIVDAATLTGAMMIALGNTHTGFYSRSREMVKKIKSAGELSGEAVWQLPLSDYHTKDMKGYYADLTNVAPTRLAGSATAAAFLENFVDSDIPWAHFDIAGTAWNVGNRHSYARTTGASGVIVRTFVQMALSSQSQ